MGDIDDPFGRGGPVPTGPADVGSPIGVPSGYIATTPSPYHRGMSALEAGADPGGLPMGQQPARYFDGDQYMPRKFTPQRIWELQQELARIGFLTGPFQKQVWDQPTADAYAKVLAYANQQGLTEQAALFKLTATGPEGSGMRFTVDEQGRIVPLGSDTGRAPLVARKTDPEVLETVFRKATTELLGEAWDPNRIRGMVAAYNQMEIQRQQDMYEAGAEGGTVVDIPSPESYAETQIEQQDPETRQKYMGMQFASEAARLMSSTAWGI